MLKKTSAAVKTCIAFPIDFPSIFRKKSMQSRAKIMKNGLVHRNRRKSTFGKSFFSKKSFLARFLWSLWVPGGLPGRPGSLPEYFNFFINLQLRLKTGPDGPQGGAQGGPWGPPGHPQGTILGRILDRFYMSKNIKKLKY